MSALIRQQIRVFTRRWPLVLIAGVTLALSIAAGAHELYLARDADILNSLGNYLRYSIVWPLAVLVLSFEFASSSRIVGMQESVDAHAATAHRHWLATIVPPAMFAVVLFGVILALKVPPVIAQGVRHALYWHVVASVVLNVLAPCLIALLLGFVVAMRLKRFAGYAAVAAFAFLAGPYSEIVPMVVQGGVIRGARGLNFYPVRDLFAVLAPDPTWYVDPLYGFPLEQARWLIAGFWLALLLGALLPTLAGPRARWSRFASPGLLCLAALLLAFVLLPSNELRRDYRLYGGSSQVSEGVYYQFQAAEHPQREEPAGFTVGRYRMDLRARRELEAVVTLSVASDTTSGEYRFTLYHGYRLARVTNARGRSLDFSQEGDYVTVRAGTKEEQLTFQYRGSGGVYPANSQCVFLPGYFPYYPVPGLVRVWDELHTAPAMVATDRGAPEFAVNFDSRAPLVSDLDLAADGSFEGSGSAPTFIGGLVSERVVAGHRIVCFPASRSNPEDLAELIVRVSDLESRLGIERGAIPDAIDIFQSPEFHMLGSATRLPRALLLSGFDESLAGDVLVADTPAKLDRSNLKEAFVRLISDPTWRAEAEHASLGVTPGEESTGTTPEGDEITHLEDARRSARSDWELVQKYVYPAKKVVFRLLLEKVQAEGEDEVLRDTYQYLSSDSELSELEFLTQSERGETP